MSLTDKNHITKNKIIIRYVSYGKKRSDIEMEYKTIFGDRFNQCILLDLLEEWKCIRTKKKQNLCSSFSI